MRDLLRLLALVSIIWVPQAFATDINALVNEYQAQLETQPAIVRAKASATLEQTTVANDRWQILLIKAKAEQALKEPQAAIASLDEILNSIPNPNDEITAKALLIKAQVTGLLLYDRPGAIPILERAQATANKIHPPNRALAREIAETLGKALMHTNQIGAAIVQFEAAQKLLHPDDSPELFAWNLFYQAQAQGVLNRYDLAEEFYLQALAKVERGTYPNLDALIYSRLANIQNERQNYSSALNYADKAIAIYTQSNDRFNLMRAFNLVGTIHSAQGDYENALVHYLNALDIDPNVSRDPLMSGLLLYNIGESYVALGQDEMAEPYLQQALELFEKGQDNQYIPAALMQLAVIAQRSERTQEALELAIRAANMAEAYSALSQRIESHAKLAEIYAQQGNFQAAWQEQKLSQQRLAERQLVPQVNDQLNNAMLERDQLVRQLDEQKSDLDHMRGQQQYQELSLQILALFTLLVLWFLYHRWRRDWRLRRAVVTARQNARLHSITGLPHQHTAEKVLSQHLVALQHRYERWYAEERGAKPSDTLRCALLALPGLEQWNHCDGLIASAAHHRAFGQQLKILSDRAGWQLFALRDGLLLAIAHRERNLDPRLSDDAASLLQLIKNSDSEQLCAVAMADFPFTSRLARAIDSERLLQVLQAALIGARQLMQNQAESAWLTLQPLDTLPSTLLATDTAAGTLLGIRNGMIRVEASHERHRIRWPTNCETMAPVMGESQSSRYTDTSLGQY